MFICISTLDLRALGLLQLYELQMDLRETGLLAARRVLGLEGERSACSSDRGGGGHPHLDQPPVSYETDGATNSSN